jgi:LmbE family N-acetylglucosaminyl deacetylase
MNILVVAPHPDDEVLGCGGSIAHHVARGDTVHVLVVTKGDPEIFPPAIVEKTRGELARAHQVLGIAGVEFLDFPAPKLDSIPGYQIADAIGKSVKRLAPRTLYLPHRGDLHTDHRMVFDAALVAARPINGCSVRTILCYETLSETEWGYPLGTDVFSPTVYIDISRHLERKLKALGCYQSQLMPAPHPRSMQAVEALARHRGSAISAVAAEAFVLVRDIVD